MSHAQDPGLFRRQDHRHHRRRERHRPRHRADLRARGRQCRLRRHQRTGRARNGGGGQRPKGSQALAVKVDVTKRGEVDAMAERAIAAFGGAQFLFNSAGAAIRRAKFLEIDDTLMEKTCRAQRQRHPSTNAGAAAAHARQPARRHRQHGEHGAPPRRSGLVDPLCGSQRRGGVDDARRGARIRQPRHSRIVDFAGADQNAVPGRGAMRRPS